MTTRFVLLAFALALPAGAAPATEWQVDPERSLFAVLTHRAGAAARLAHDHLIVARSVATTLDFDPERPEAARVEFSAAVEALDVDPPAERAARAARLAELGVLEGALPPIDEGDRAKIRAAMLAGDQLDAARHPRIAAELVALARRGGEGARVALGWDARVRLTLRGRTVEKTFPARWEVRDGELVAEALGEFRFTELGIEPYSTLLGAIRNADLFHVFVVVVACPAAGAPPAATP